MNENNFVCLITGPAGAGKSTIVEALCKEYPRTARLDVDYLRHIIKNGRVKPFPYTAEAIKQVELATTNTCTLAKNLIDYGFNVFIDDVVTSSDILDLFFTLLAGYKMFVFLLLPDKNILRDRDRNRPDEQIMGARALQLHEEFIKRLGNETRWTVINSSKQTVDETKATILKYLNNQNL
jgi:adenylate kinase family enzyme